MKPVVIDLCAGRGGWTTGFLAEGCKLVAMGTVLVGVLVGCILALVAVLVFGEDY